MTKDWLFKRPEVFAALALGALYLAVMSGHSYSIDGLLMYRQAVAIVHGFSLRFEVPIHWGGDVFMTSRYGIGLSLIYLPGVTLLTLAGVPAVTPAPTAYDGDLFYRDLVYTVGAAPIHVLVAMTTAYLVARFVRELGYGSKTGLRALAAYGIASPAIVYARGDFAQPLLGLCLMVGLLAAQRYRVSGGGPAMLAAGGSVVLAVLTRPVEGSLLLPALLLVMIPELRPSQWSAGTYRTIAAITASYVIAVALTLLVNWGRFGSPVETGYSGQINWGTPIWVGVPGVLVSPARGILWQFPLIFLAPLGLWRLKQTQYRAVAFVTAGLAFLLFFNNALWSPWWGGWNWGSRLFVPAWPLVAVLAAIGAGSLRGSLRVWLPASLFVAGVVWAVPGTVTDLLGGYASTYDGSAQSFALSGYPPIGAWRFVHHLRAITLGDSNAVDILWFRLGRRTSDFALLVPLVLMVSAMGLAWMALRAERLWVGSPAKRVELEKPVKARD